MRSLQLRDRGTMVRALKMDSVAMARLALMPTFSLMRMGSTTP